MILNLIDWILLFALGLPVLYLFVFALFSMRRSGTPFPTAQRQRRFVTLIPAYKADAVILRTAEAALAQEYPSELHRVAVIADRMRPETVEALRRLPLTVYEVRFENSSKAKALQHAVRELGPDAAEGVAILDADNLVPPDFIARMNDALDAGIEAVQAHRTARNRDTATAVLDAASEEINNAIFRRGHVALGFSSALIGSGMAFRYDRFAENIARCTTSGEDKELEALLLRQGVYIDYLADVRVLDEKVQAEGAYYNQRRRWIAAQFYAFGMAVRRFPGALLAGNWDYCDKLVQWCLPPRMLLVGFVPLWTVAMTCIDPLQSLKWWAVSLLLAFALAMALPDEQTDEKLARALGRIPVLILLTVRNLFRLGGTRDRFIHTEHTGAGGDSAQLPAPDSAKSVPKAKAEPEPTATRNRQANTAKREIQRAEAGAERSQDTAKRNRPTETDGKRAAGTAKRVPQAEPTATRNRQADADVERAQDTAKRNRQADADAERAGAGPIRTESAQDSAQDSTARSRPATNPAKTPES